MALVGAPRGSHRAHARSARSPLRMLVAAVVVALLLHAHGAAAQWGDGDDWDWDFDDTGDDWWDITMDDPNAGPCTDSGHAFHERTGTISSHDRDKYFTYAVGQDCTWTIAPDGLEAHECIMLEFEVLFVEDDYDYLYVRRNDEAQTLIEEITGEYAEGYRIHTEAQDVLVHFVSDEAFNFDGFLIHYSIETCTGHALTATGCVETGARTNRTGELLSTAPGVSLVEEELDCHWHIAPALEEGECVHVEVLELDISDINDEAGFVTVKNDWFDVTLEQPDVAREGEFASRSPIDVRFVTHANLAGRGRGLVVEYDVVPCGQVLHVAGPRDAAHWCEPWHTTEREGEVPEFTQRVKDEFHARGCNPTFLIDPPLHEEHDDDETCIRVEGELGRTSPILTLTSDDVHVIEDNWSAATSLWAEMYHFSYSFPHATTVVFDPRADWMQPADTFHVTWSVVPCSGAYQQLRQLIDVCDVLRHALAPVGNGWDSFVEQKGTCCGSHTNSGRLLSGMRARITVECDGFVPTELAIDGVPTPLGLDPTVMGSIKTLTLTRVPVPTAWPEHLEDLSIDTLLGMSSLDVSHLPLRKLVVEGAPSLESIQLPGTLEVLELSNTFLPDLSMIGKLTRLHRLALTNVRVGDTSHVEYAVSLEELIVADVPLPVLPRHEGLRILRCAYCDITHLASLPNTLESLGISGNTFESGTLPPMPASLTMFKCASCNLHSIDISQCMGLKEIEVMGNHLTALDVSKLTKLEKLSVSSNADLASIGTLPPSVDSVDVSRTKIPVPEAWPPAMWLLSAESMAWTSAPAFPGTLRSLTVSGTPLGRIEWVEYPLFLYTLLASECKLTEAPFATVPVSMRTMDLSKNMITEVPLVYSGLHLQNFIMSHNRLTTVQLDGSYDLLRLNDNQLISIGASVEVEFLDVSNNMLTELPLLVSTRVLRAANNMLSSVSVTSYEDRYGAFGGLHGMFMFLDPLALRVGTQLVAEVDDTIFDLSHNNFTSTASIALPFFVDYLVLNNNEIEDWHVTTSVRKGLDVSHNKLTDFHAVVSCLANTVTNIDLSHNNLKSSGRLATFPSSMENVEALDLSHNNFEGPVPSLNSMPALRTFSMTQSGFRAVFDGDCADTPTAPECLGEGMQLGEWHLDSRRRTLCPQLESSSGLFTIDTFDYANKELCECAFGYVGARGECMACPEHAVCRDTLVAPESGYWVHPLPKERLGEVGKAVLQCPPRFADVCAPKSDLAAIVSALEGDSLDELPACSTGHTDRMCARCDSDYFVWGNKCRVCPHPSGLFFLLAFSAVVVAAVCAYAYLVKPSANASLKILIFFTQTIQLARSTGVPMDDNMASVFDVFGSVMVDMPGIECVWPSYTFHDDVYLAMAMPLMAAVLVMAVFAVGSALRAQGGDMAKWWNRNVGALLLLNFFLYLRVSSSVLAPLRCESDPFLDENFFASAPAERCDATLLGVSWMMVVVYVIGAPVGIGAWVFSKRHMLDDETVAARFSFLFASYKKDHWYWEGVITLRKLLILAFLASFRRSSVMVPLMIFLVLVVSVVLQHRVQPFLDATDNHIEFVLLIALSILFALLVVTNAPMLFMSSWLGMLVMLMQLVCVAGVLYIMIQRQRQRGIGRLATKAVSFLNVNRLTGSVARRPKEKAEQSPLLTGSAQA